jgi:hypothetical protein
MRPEGYHRYSQQDAEDNMVHADKKGSIRISQQKEVHQKA